MATETTHGLDSRLLESFCIPESWESPVLSCSAYTALRLRMFSAAASKTNPDFPYRTKGKREPSQRVHDVHA